MKIVITGGHHNSAMVIAQELMALNHQVFWVGQKFPIIKNKNPSVEFQEVTQENIPFYNIVAGKLQLNYRFIPYLMRIPVGFIQAFGYLLKIRPKLVFSFGGYVGLPVAICAKLLGITVFTHEQTVLTDLGLANRIIEKIADRVFISFPRHISPNREQKLIYSGLPIRGSIYSDRKVFDNRKKTIYVTGGKQGGHKINEIIFELLPKLLVNYNIIHQCGSNTEYNDFAKAHRLASDLGPLSKHYLVCDYFTQDKIGAIFNTADLLITRAGAHTVYEILVLNKPAIVIPIPWTHFDEQTKNAYHLVNSGLAELITEDKLDPNTLNEKIQLMFRQYRCYHIKPGYRVPGDADKTIIREIQRLTV